MKPEQPKKREWPKFATGPKGQRARFDCESDVVAGWILDGMTEPLKPHKNPAPAKVETAPEPTAPEPDVKRPYRRKAP